MKENADKARGLDAAELNKQLRDSAEQRFRLRFQMSMGQMEGLKKYRSLRKERARMLTVLRERELKIEPAARGEKKTPKAKPVAAAPKAVKPVAKVKAAAKPAVAKRTAPKASTKPAVAPKPRKSSKG
jgi:large subunit ribosomal protein L29